MKNTTIRIKKLLLKEFYELTVVAIGCLLGYGLFHLVHNNII